MNLLAQRTPDGIGMPIVKIKHLTQILKSWLNKVANISMVDEFTDPNLEQYNVENIHVSFTSL